MTLFNASGDIVAEDIALQTELFSHVWQGHGYLSALDSHGRVGLMDSTGSWAIAPEMDYIYGISNGYALCVLEDGSYRAISLEDGTTFDCAYGICDVYDQGLILELDETAFHYGTVLFTENAYEQFVSWDGTVLAEGNRIQVLDDEGDGNAELVEEGNYPTDLLDESGKVLLSDLVSMYSHQDGGVFTVLRDGKPALMRLDGTLLYQSS